MREYHTSENEEFELQSKDKISVLRGKLKECEAEKMKHLEELQRVRADFLNSKRRLEEQLARDTERITERVLIDFLPLLDSFDTALQGSEETHTDAWKKGVIAMHAQFTSLLKSYRINEIETVGKPFDPYEHEAVGSRPTGEDEIPDTVIQVLQKGYKREDVVIRPAKVIITA
jgi:molecular chaperone GrpE